MQKLPQTIYLDHSQVSKLALQRERPEIIKKFCLLAESGGITPVFSTGHIYETWKHGDITAQEQIAAFVDSLSNCLWILNHHLVIKNEIENAFLAFVGYTSKPFHPLCREIQHTWYEGMPEPIEIVVDHLTFGYVLNLINNNNELSSHFYRDWKRLELLFPEAKQRLLDRLSGRPKEMRAIIRELRESLAENIPGRTPDGNLVTAQQKKKFLSQAHWDRYEEWPSTYLYCKMMEEMVRNMTGRIKPSHILDHFHVAALPYVDIFLTDGQTRDLIRRTHLPQHVFAHCFTSLTLALQAH